MPRAAADESVFHAVADATRRALLDLLRDRERAVGELVERVEVSQSAVSQHLAVLRRAGLVGVRSQGRRRLYRLEPEPLREVADWIAHYERFWPARLRALREYLDRHDPEET